MNNNKVHYVLASALFALSFAACVTDAEDGSNDEVGGASNAIDLIDDVSGRSDNEEQVQSDSEAITSLSTTQTFCCKEEGCAPLRAGSCDGSILKCDDASCVTSVDGREVAVDKSRAFQTAQEVERQIAEGKAPREIFVYGEPMLFDLGEDPWLADPGCIMEEPPNGYDCDTIHTGGGNGGGSGGGNPPPPSCGAAGEADCTWCTLSYAACVLKNPSLIGFIACSYQFIKCAQKKCDC